jgi:hypothetical protein
MWHEASVRPIETFRSVLKIHRSNLVMVFRLRREVDVSARWVAALGGAISFVVAGVAGVMGNQLSKDAGWVWVAFGIILILGAAVTGWTAYRTAKSGGAAHRGDPHAGEVTHVGDATVGKVSADGGQAVGVNYGTMTQAHRREES